MKCKLAFLSLAMLILSACAPVVVPTAAPATATPAPRATFIATPAPTATSVPTVAPTATTTTKHYEHDEFTFDYPATWQAHADFWPKRWSRPYKPTHDRDLDADELGGVLLPNISPTPGMTDQPSALAYVEIYRRSLPAASTLKEIYERTYSSGYPQSNSISDRTVTVDGVMALEKVYRKPHGIPWYQVREVWLEKNGKIYIISCRTEPFSFDKYQPDFNLIVDSFHIK